MTPRGRDWLAVACVPLGMLLALFAVLADQPGAARVLFGAGFFLYGSAGLSRGRILIGNRAALLCGVRARLAGIAFVAAGLCIAFLPPSS